jgi:D-glycero-D-manno-heptose 1,7-bisphosphate phosphatase
MNKLLILDRDGVINYDSFDYIKTPEEWKAIPGSLDAIAQMNRAGFRVIIATNQSGIGRQYYDVATLDMIHEKMQSELATVGGHIEEIFFCPHLPKENCECRKPSPGLLMQIKDKYDVELSDVYFVGDKLSDIEAGNAAGCQPLLVLTALVPVEDKAVLESVPTFENLAGAVEYILRGK